MSPRLVLIGELNPYGPTADYALYCSPKGSAGERLPRYNLCDYRWPIAAARLRAAELARSHADDVLVLLGRKVAAAFGFVATPPSTIVDGAPQRVILPHPSGLCRVWHEPGAFDRARDLVALALAGGAT